MQEERQKKEGRKTAQGRRQEGTGGGEVCQQLQECLEYPRNLGTTILVL